MGPDLRRRPASREAVDAMTLQAIVLSGDWFRFVGALIVIGGAACGVVRIMEWVEQ